MRGMVGGNAHEEMGRGGPLMHKSTFSQRRCHTAIHAALARGACAASGRPVTSRHVTSRRGEPGKGHHGGGLEEPQKVGRK